MILQTFENITKLKNILRKHDKYECVCIFSGTNIGQIILNQSFSLAKEADAITMGTSNKGNRQLSLSPWDGTLNQQCTQGSKVGFFHVRNGSQVFWWEVVNPKHYLSAFVSQKLIFVQFQSNVSEFLVWFTYINFPFYFQFLVILQGYSK